MDEKDTAGAVEIGGRTRLCGLIGNPVEHTLSPMIHNTLAAACGCAKQEERGESGLGPIFL